jgi:hypothetical protein
MRRAENARSRNFHRAFKPATTAMTTPSFTHSHTPHLKASSKLHPTTRCVPDNVLMKNVIPLYSVNGHGHHLESDSRAVIFTMTEAAPDSLFYDFTMILYWRLIANWSLMSNAEHCRRDTTIKRKWQRK